MQVDEELPRAPPSAHGPIAEFSRFGRAVKRLLGAQWQLLIAEFGVARSAVSWLLLAGLAIVVAGVGLGLSLLALAALALASWLGSWLWALLALCGLQFLFLLGGIMLFRRCVHWMSLPRSRSQWSALMRDLGRADDVEALKAKDEALHTHGADQA